MRPPTAPKPIPLCIDCKYAKPHYIAKWAWARCIAPQTYTVDPVTGRTIHRYTETCAEQRIAITRCGPNGEWFKQRE